MKILILKFRNIPKLIFESLIRYFYITEIVIYSILTPSVYIFLDRSEVLIENLIVKDIAPSFITALAILTGVTFIASNIVLNTLNVEKLKDIGNDLSIIVNENFDKFFGHPRETKILRYPFVEWMMYRYGIEDKLFNQSDEPHYTFRPYWDGVWFYGNDNYNKKYQNILPFFFRLHEFIMCAHMILRHVWILRHSKFRNIIRDDHGSLGTTSFLKQFGKYEWTISHSLKNMSVYESEIIVNLATYSLHYMHEEFREERESNWDEYKKVRFYFIFIDYMIWVCHFYQSFMEARMANFIVAKKFNERRENLFLKEIREISNLRSKLFDLRSDILPRISVAERIWQIRYACIVPICLTFASVTMILILSYGEFYNVSLDVSFIHLTLTLVSVAILSNFLFGVWLLLPSRFQSKRSLFEIHPLDT